MPLYRRSLLDVESLTPDSIEFLFSRATHFLECCFDLSDALRARRFVVALLFFEPSTRTRMSFEMAALRLGVSTLRLDDANTTSLAKGETLTDTLLNVIAMGPQAVIVRYGEDPDLKEALSRSAIPVLSAGQGTKSHPTQALLDAFTISRSRGQVAGERVLIVGDVMHSRVAYSNIELLKKLGAHVAVCGPKEWTQLDARAGQDVISFENVEEGLRWASVCMALRIQLERLNPAQFVDSKTYRLQYGLTSARLRANFSNEGVILHPGPIDQNVEIDSDVLLDPRCHVLAQVAGGVAVRSALLESCLGLSSHGERFDEAREKGKKP